MEDNNYKFEFMDTIWDRIRFWFLIRRMRRDKQLILWEANMDKIYTLKMYGEQLKYDEAADRKILTEENRKPLDQQDKTIINDAEDRIAMGAAVKSNWRKNEMLIKELKDYINMIDTWKSQS